MEAAFFGGCGGTPQPARETRALPGIFTASVVIYMLISFIMGLLPKSPEKEQITIDIL
jgi:hypothetical protein